MGKAILADSLILIFVLSACNNATFTAPQPITVPITPTGPINRAAHPDWFLTATVVPPIPAVSSPTLAGPLATIIAAFDMGGGGSGFDSIIYAQEVFTGKTFHTFMSVGDHHAEAVFREEPVIFLIQAPGTYVFYARLAYAPGLFHYGATGCPPMTDCPHATLKALEVLPDSIYHVVITDRSADLPISDLPVTVPWEMADDR